MVTAAAAVLLSQCMTYNLQVCNATLICTNATDVLIGDQYMFLDSSTAALKDNTAVIIRAGAENIKLHLEFANS